MSVVESSATLTALDSGFRNKIEALKVCVDLRGGWEEDTVAEFGQLAVQLQNLHQDVVRYRNILTTAKKDMLAALSLLQQAQQLTQRLSHMKTNLPIHVPHANAADASTAHLKEKQTANKENTLPSGQEKGKIVAGKKRQIPTIEFVTVEEFESVPKYIRGRLQYDQVNSAVNEMNTTLETKYSLISRPRAKLSQMDMKIVTACRRQENQETRGLYFVVDDDIKRWSGLKLDTAGRSLLTVLRTLKRIREVRGPGNIQRFAVLV